VGGGEVVNDYPSNEVEAIGRQMMAKIESPAEQGEQLTRQDYLALFAVTVLLPLILVVIGVLQ